MGLRCVFLHHYDRLEALGHHQKAERQAPATPWLSYGCRSPTQSLLSIFSALTAEDADVSVLIETVSGRNASITLSGEDD